MAFFGKSEAELKQITNALIKRRNELENRESEFKSVQSNFEHEKKLLEDAKANFGNDRKAFREKLKKDYESIASEKAELEKRRIEISKLEAEAKAGFVEKQRDAFKEVIEKRISELDARQQELDGLGNKLSSKLRELHSTEGEIAKRELAVTEREQKADAGFADKAKALADEAARQHQANQAEADRLRKLADAFTKDRQGLEVEKAKLVEREQAIIDAEQKRDAGFADERAAMDIELKAKRAKMESEIGDAREQKLSAIEDEIVKLKTKRLEEVIKAEKTERDRIRAEIANELGAWTKQQENTRKQLESERTELERQKSAVSALRSELEGRKTELEANERTLERKEQRLERQWQKRNDELDNKIEEQLEEKRKSLETDKQSFKTENARLRESLRIQTELVGAFDQLERILGGKDPAEIIRDLNSKTDELKRLHEELATRPTEEMREKYQEMEYISKRQKARIEELDKQVEANALMIAEAAELRRKNSEFEAENKSLKHRYGLIEAENNEMKDRLDKLKRSYDRIQDREDRIRDIETPYIQNELPRNADFKSEAQQFLKLQQEEEKSRELGQELSNEKKKKYSDLEKIVGAKELQWLEGISNSCIDYGLKFPRRILHAFHTAIKTSEWSPVTVLAGVSGTGKSELPRLYSHFGGINFLSLSVQPNWDSQESMLGFFNSIDNRFDAQPVLRLLAQSQKAKSNDYPLGLEDVMSLILMDEMNLAHVELYFAEFLSKLELRRGQKGGEVPSLEVKLGAGIPHYDLPLGRNILWAGTMNQDETTKSLSDKVLDRGIVINFPRPISLERRRRLKPLGDRAPLLSRRLWESWWCRESKFNDDQILSFKGFIEEMNTSLSKVGRALGHRDMAIN